MAQSKRKECKKCAELMSVIQDIWWMARRYADGRLSYAPGMFNRAINKAMNNGLECNPDIVAKPVPSMYAKGGEE